MITLIAKNKHQNKHQRKIKLTRGLKSSFYFFNDLDIIVFNRLH